MPYKKRCYLCKRKPKNEQEESQQPPVGTLCFHKFPQRDPQTLEAWLKVCGLSAKDDISNLFICSFHFTVKDYVEPRAISLGGRLFLKPKVVPSLSVPSIAPKAVLTTFTEEKALNFFTSNFEEINSLTFAPEESASAYTRQENIFDPMEKIPWTLADDMFVGQFVEVMDVEAPDFLLSPTEQQIDVMSNEFETPKKRKFSEPRYVSEIMVSDFATPERAKRMLALVKQADAEKSKLIKRLHAKNRYLMKKNDALKEVVKRLKNKRQVEEDTSD